MKSWIRPRKYLLKMLEMAFARHPVIQSVIMFIYLSVCQSVSESVNESVSQLVSHYVCLSICLSVSQSVSESVSQCVSQSLCLSVSQSVSQSINPSVNKNNSNNNQLLNWQASRGVFHQSVIIRNALSDYFLKESIVSLLLYWLGNACLSPGIQRNNSYGFATKERTTSKGQWTIRSYKSEKGQKEIWEKKILLIYIYNVDKF